MRFLDRKWLDAQLKKSTNPPGRKPMPFPGKWPTKLAIWGEVYARFEGRRKKFFYLGKPSPNIITKFRLTCEKSCSGSLQIAEVDRGGIVALGTRHGLPCSVPSWEIQRWNEKIWKYYHFWSLSSIIGPFLQRYQVKRIRCMNQIHRVYSPHLKLEREAHLRPFKAWLLRNSAVLGMTNEITGEDVRLRPGQPARPAEDNF